MKRLDEANQEIKDNEPVHGDEDGLRRGRRRLGQAQRVLLADDVLAEEQHALLQRNDVRHLLQQQLSVDFIMVKFRSSVLKK